MALGCVPGANLDGFWLQKSTKICSWTALGPSCGRLGPSWGRLGASWKRLNASWHVLETLQEAPERESMNFQWFQEVLAVEDRGESTGARGRARARDGGAVWSGPLNYHLPFTIYHTPLPLTIYHLPFTIHHCHCHWLFAV